jgi:hypothetical protein
MENVLKRIKCFGFKWEPFQSSEDLKPPIFNLPIRWQPERCDSEHGCSGRSLTISSFRSSPASSDPHQDGRGLIPLGLNHSLPRVVSFKANRAEVLYGNVKTSSMTPQAARFNVNRWKQQPLRTASGMTNPNRNCQALHSLHCAKYIAVWSCPNHHA